MYSNHSDDADKKIIQSVIESVTENICVTHTSSLFLYNVPQF